MPPRAGQRNGGFCERRDLRCTKNVSGPFLEDDEPVVMAEWSERVLRSRRSLVIPLFDVLPLNMFLSQGRIRQKRRFWYSCVFLK